MGYAEDGQTMTERFGSPADIEVCRQIHKRFGTTYYYSTLRFPDEIRWRVHGLYAFVRVPDEWADNPDGTTVVEPPHPPETRAEIAPWQFLLQHHLDQRLQLCRTHFQIANTQGGKRAAEGDDIITNAINDSGARLAVLGEAGDGKVVLLHLDHAGTQKLHIARDIQADGQRHDLAAAYHHLQRP